MTTCGAVIVEPGNGPERPGKSRAGRILCHRPDGHVGEHLPKPKLRGQMVPLPEDVDRAMRLTKLAKLASGIPDYEGLSKKAHDLSIRALKAAKVLLDRDDNGM